MRKNRLLQHRRARVGHGVLADLLDESLARPVGHDGDPPGKTPADQPRGEDPGPQKTTGQTTGEAAGVERTVLKVVDGPQGLTPSKTPVARAAGRRRHRRKATSEPTAQDVLKSAPKLLGIVRYLLDQQILSGGDETRWLRKDEIARAIQDPPKNMAAALWDAMSYGLVVRVRTKHGRGGGTVYRVPVELHSDVMRLAQSPRVRTRPEDISAAQKHDERRFGLAVEQFALDEWGIGANDLLSVWRRRAADGRRLFASADELIESADRIAFYLRTPQAEGIRDPRRWALSQLKQGVYGRPAGYRSWRERQEEQRLEAVRQEAQAVAKAQRERVESEFEIWLAALPGERARQLSNGFAPESLVGRGLLKEVFMREKGYGETESPR